jgi:hypothetical protein
MVQAVAAFAPARNGIRAFFPKRESRSLSLSLEPREVASVWALYVKDGRPVYTYNSLGLKRYSVTSQQQLAAGKNAIRFEFA